MIYVYKGRKGLKAAKRIIHEDCINPLWNRGVPRGRIYAEISKEVGFTFHCADLTEKMDLNKIVGTVFDVVKKLSLEFEEK